MGIWKVIFGPQVWVAIGLVAVVAIFIGLIVPIWIWPKISLQGVDEPQPPPGIRAPGLVESQLEQFKEQYGPWLTNVEAKELRSTVGVRNFVLLYDDGNVLYSAQSTAFTTQAPWRTSRSPEITGVNIWEEKHVDLRNQLGENFTLNVTQPFIFAGRFDRVYIVDEYRQIWSAPIVELSFTDARQLSDPDIMPNPGLSLSFGD